MLAVNKDNRFCSIDVAKELGISSHYEWMKKNVIPNRDEIIRVTKEPLPIESVPNKRGKPSMVAYFTMTQLVYLVSNSTISSKNNIKKKKDEFAKMFQEVAERADWIESQRQWTVYKNNILTNNTLRPSDVTENEWGDEYKEYLPEGYTDGFFSPDVVFAEFLEALESDASYSLKWDFGIEREYTYTVTREEFEKLKTYEYLISYDKHFAPDGEVTECYMCMWGEDGLPELPDLAIEDEVPPWGVTWITEPKGFKAAWRNFVKEALNIVDIYNSPELRKKYGIVSPEEEATGYWDNEIEGNSEPLKRILKADEKMDHLLMEHNDQEALGFQVHKDWVNWLQEETRQAQIARELHLGSPQVVVFDNRKIKNNYTFDDLIMGRNTSEYIYKSDPRTKYIHYEHWEAYENGFEWDKNYSEIWEALNGCDQDNLPEPPPLRADRPLFEHVRIYSNELRSLFDWYLNNVWLPQHSVKYFQQIDPEGFPQLCQAMKALPPNSKVPYQFTKAMQPILTAA